MTGPVIPADQWPSWADRHCWDEDGQGRFYGVALSGDAWVTIEFPSSVAMPDGHDWRAQVMRPGAGDVDARKAFEEWADGAGYPIHRGFGKADNYGSSETRQMLEAWEAGRQAAVIDGQVTPNDTHRLEWLMRNISGAELRRINVWTAANCDREAIDDAMSAQPTKGEGE